MDNKFLRIKRLKELLLFLIDCCVFALEVAGHVYRKKRLIKGAIVRTIKLAKKKKNER